MKNLIKLLSLVAVIMAVVVLACACGNTETPESSTQSSQVTGSSTVDSTGSEDNKEPESTVKDYTVKALDPFGNPLEVSVIVEFFKDGESLGEMPMRNGSAVFKQEAGDYSFTLSPMEGEFYYNQADCVLSAEVTEKTITLYNYADDTDKQQIYVYDEDALDHVPYDAVQVTEGAVYVKIDRPANTYFVFTPTRGGIYKVSYESSKSVTLGYYGSPHNVLQSCPLDVVDGAFELEVKNDSVNIGNEGGTSQIVIGIRSFTVKNCVLKIERIGDPTVDMPWVDVHADKNAVKVDNYLNSEFVDFDVTDSSLSVVYNENDGYYHLNSADGPVIFVRINNSVILSSTENETIYKYLPSFIAMGETDRLGKVFYDEDGKIVLKESYNELFKEYDALCGTSGLYPLNKQLADAIKNTGEHKGWFDLDGELHIFGQNANSVVTENAWLFACVYENQNAYGTEEKPAPVAVNGAEDVKNYAVLMSGNQAVVLRTVNSATLTINNAENVKVILSDGTEYTADAEGKLTCLVEGVQNFKLIYEGEEGDCVIHFTFVEYIG